MLPIPLSLTDLRIGFGLVPTQYFHSNAGSQPYTWDLY